MFNKNKHGNVRLVSHKIDSRPRTLKSDLNQIVQPIELSLHLLRFEYEGGIRRLDGVYASVLVGHVIGGYEPGVPIGPLRGVVDFVPAHVSETPHDAGLIGNHCGPLDENIIEVLQGLILGVVRHVVDVKTQLLFYIYSRSVSIKKNSNHVLSHETSCYQKKIV